MGTFNELPGIKQWGLLLLGAIVVTAGLYFTLFNSQRNANVQAEQQLQAKIRENNELEAYRPKLAEMERQLATLKQQLDIERRIVPDEKQADDFIRAVDGEAMKAGVELRRFTAMPVSNKDFYSEMPFELEIDGPYYSMLNFFDRVGKLERIVNVSNLLIASVKKPTEAKAKHVYTYAPGESVVATCVATTFFSHDMTPPANAPVGASVKQVGKTL